MRKNKIRKIRRKIRKDDNHHLYRAMSLARMIERIEDHIGYRDVGIEKRSEADKDLLRTRFQGRINTCKRKIEWHKHKMAKLR